MKLQGYVPCECQVQCLRDALEWVARERAQGEALCIPDPIQAKTQANLLFPVKSWFNPFVLLGHRFMCHNTSASLDNTSQFSFCFTRVDQVLDN